MAVTENNSSKFKKCALALAIASCMSLATTAAEAAGLGKLTVFSSLGQPLKAEVELSATGEELLGMNARLASPDTFKQAGVEYASSLTDLSFKVERRANGKSVLRLSSARPVNEPFLDFLVELTWPSGRLVREYTFLLDPPEFASGTGMRTSVDAKIVETVRGGGVLPEPVVPAKKPEAAVTPAVKPTEKAPPGDAATRLVERGDTLFKIANERRYASVSLEQMLVGLYRNNRNAFFENDINRLKAGVILNIPDESTVAAIPQREARSVYVSAGDFAAYRRKLAAAAAAEAKAEAPATQASGGQIAPKVDEKTPALDTSRDQVKVSRADAPVSAEIDRVASDKALQESQARVALLERNLTELQKLLEMKNQRLAELEKPVPAAEPPAPEVKPAEPAVVPAAQEGARVIDSATAEPPADSAPVAPAAAEPPPAVATPPAVPPPPIVEDTPPVEDSLLDSALPLAGGAAAIALLAGLLLYRRRRKPEGGEVETTAAPSPSSLGPNSVFRMTGGQSVDTASTPPHTGEFSQAGPGTIDTDEVDPVAEADVYMAYGRDAQAEEILLEAMQKDPGRLAIHAKLLEIYANRRSIKQFETLASELYAQTAGVGPEWQKVAALGAEIDPGNPLYGSVAQPAKPLAQPAAFDPDATLVASAAAVAAATAVSSLSAQSEPAAAQVAAEQVDEVAVEEALPVMDEIVASEPVADDGMSLDFDLGDEVRAAMAQDEHVPEPVVAEAKPQEPYVDTVVTGENPPDALDFDLSGMVGGDSSLGAVPLDAEPDNKVELTETFDLPPLESPASQASTAEDPAADAEDDRDFSPEGTLVISSADGFQQAAGADDFSLDDLPEAIEFEGSANEVVAEDEPATTSEMPAEPVERAAAAVVPAAPEEIRDEPLTMDAPDLVNTIVNPMGVDTEDMDFDVKLSDSVFLGQPMAPSEFDIGSINLDLSAEPEESAMAPAALPEPAGLPEAFEEAAPDVHDAQWEEVNTKLDLAKAYEEMGDLEGARELLQEVLNEGSGELIEQAETILARIGG
jgi:pilus assembly protein FimV